MPVTIDRRAAGTLGPIRTATFRPPAGLRPTVKPFEPGDFDHIDEVN